MVDCLGSEINWTRPMTVPGFPEAPNLERLEP